MTAWVVILDRELGQSANRKCTQFASVQGDVVILVQSLPRSGLALHQPPSKPPESLETPDTEFIPELRIASILASRADREVTLESVMPESLLRYDPIRSPVEQRSEYRDTFAKNSEDDLENAECAPGRWHERNRVSAVHDSVNWGSEVVHQVVIPNSGRSKRVARSE